MCFDVVFNARKQGGSSYMLQTFDQVVIELHSSKGIFMDVISNRSPVATLRPDLALSVTSFSRL